jgi:N-acetylmuramoyl-L-alanine amidase
MPLHQDLSPQKTRNQAPSFFPGQHCALSVLLLALLLSSLFVVSAPAQSLPASALDASREILIDLQSPEGVQEELLPTWEYEGARYFSLQDLLRLQSLLHEAGAGYCILNAEGHRLTFQSGSRFARLDEGLYQMERAVLLVEEGLLLHVAMLEYLVDLRFLRGHFLDANRLSLDTSRLSLAQEGLAGGSMIRLRFQSEIPFYESEVSAKKVSLTFPLGGEMDALPAQLSALHWPSQDTWVLRTHCQRTATGLGLSFTLPKGVELLELVEVESLNEIQIVLKNVGRALREQAFAVAPEAVFVPPDRALHLRRIVLDPGHGGKDPGAVSPNRKYEKDVVLAICLELKRQLQKRIPGVEVLLTRDVDRFISLSRRTEFANEKQADLFVSVHANAAKDRRARGSEVYFLRHGKNRHAREVALRENASLDFEDRASSGQVVKTQSDWILATMAQTAWARESQNLAALIAKEMRTVGYTRRRSVLQAGFQVLVGASMPAVLFECGFISNGKDERQMTSKAGRQEIASALCDAIVEFKVHYE